MRRAVRTSDGVDLAVVEFGGAGDPILLLHGLMGRATTWWTVAEKLAAFGRVLGLDARGHGRSAARGPWSTDRMAADVTELLAQLGPAVVVGHSMGGLHGLVAAARRADLVRALVVEDMGVDFRGRDADAVRSWFGAMPQPFPSLAAVDHTTEIAAEWAARDHWDAVAAVRCPTLLVEAEESVAPAGQMELMAGRMPAATHVLVPGTGHLVHAGAPQAYLAAIESFLSTHM